MKRKTSYRGRLLLYMIMPLLMLIPLGVITGILFYLNLQAGQVILVMMLIYAALVIAMYVSNRTLFFQEMINFATQYASVQKELLDGFELGYALLDASGKILWVNRHFTDLTGKEKSYHKSITTVFPSITKELLLKEEVHSVAAVLGERSYRVLFSRIQLSSLTESTEMISIRQEDAAEYLTALYLFDETELNRVNIENEEQRLVAGLVYIDNYDEVLESMEDVKKSMLVALVDRRVNKYFADSDALVRKIENDKYFVVFKNRFLPRMEEDRFHLLDDVKTIKVGNEIAVTLSIGLGATASTYAENYEYAHAAIDLALGRGGDQVVVKEGEEITYYGGAAKQVEKNTRVKARVKAHALREMMETHSRILVMGHHLSDPDAFGAAIGVCAAAKEVGKKSQIVLNEITATLRREMEIFSVEKGYDADLFVNSEQALEFADRNTLVMVVDTNRPSYTECPELLKRGLNIVVFDHHRQGNEVIESPLLSYIEPYASSTCEMIAEVLQYFSDNMKLTADEADAIYAGILIDTNNFMTKTGVRTFEAAAYLKRSGVDVTRVRKMMRNDMAAYKERAEILRKAEVYRNAFAISACDSEMVESPTIVGAQAANELLNIIGIKASFVLAEFQNKIFISSRSIDEINVQLIMERLGGGGHVSVAGAQFTDCTIEEAKQRIRDVLDAMIEEGDIKL